MTESDLNAVVAKLHAQRADIDRTIKVLERLQKEGVMTKDVIEALRSLGVKRGK